MENSKPLIGLVVSTHIKETGDVVVNPKIRGLVEEFGGEVAAIDYRTIKSDELEKIVDAVDGVILPGGGDVDPGYYCEERLPECGEPDDARDTVEMALLMMATARSLPIMGICRGSQMINVFMGGTLWQDLPSQKGVCHRQDDANGKYCHNADIKPGSRLYGILNAGKLLINSYHHQAVRELAAGLTVSAVSENDGIIEAFEGDNIMGIQWHPESVPEDPASKLIFKAYLDAVNNNRR